MKNKINFISVALELATVLLITVATFLWGVATARAERGYAACGGEYLFLLIPAFYYAGKPLVVDWITDIRKLWRKRP